jgi:glycosyltransferase involved in cell wall biosynthesis
MIIHHIWMNEGSQIPSLGRLLRLWLILRCRNFAVSRALGDSLPVPYEVAPNPYDDRLFSDSYDIPRDRDLVFLGRLEPLKGAPDVVDAVALLKHRGFKVNLTIVGGGSMEAELKRKTRELSLGTSITFAGRVPGNELAPLLAKHKIMLVPSRYHEPFGVVALEGIACGCVVIGSSGGGLPEAIGPCGITFTNGDVAELADKIEKLLSQPDLLEAYRTKAPAHLLRHRPSAVATEYLRLLQKHVAI